MAKNNFKTYLTAAVTKDKYCEIVRYIKFPNACLSWHVTFHPRKIVMVSFPKRSQTKTV
jgi:hypothetical protein